MRPLPRPGGLGARAVGGLWRLAGLICTLALADEDLGGKGVSSLEARSLDDASLLIQSFPPADPPVSVAAEPYLKLASARYLDRHKKIVGRRRTRRAGKQAPAAGGPQLAAPPAEGSEAAGAAEPLKPPGWYEARARELQEAVTRVDNATGQETAEWWEARAKELREARKEIKRLAWQKSRDETLRALAAEEERRRAKRRDFAAQQEARQRAREAFAERKRRARELAEQRARWREDEEEAIRELSGERMNVTVRDSQGKELHFHFRTALPLKVMMGYVAGKLGVKPGQARLTFQGKEFEANATADGIGLQDHGVVDLDGRLPAEGEERPNAWEDADLPEPGRVHLVVKNVSSGREVHVEMLSTARLQLLMGLTCRRLRLEQKEFRFMHNGTQLRSGDTPERIGLADRAIIEIEPDPAYFEALRRAAEEARQKEEAKRRAKEEAERRARELRERKEQAAFEKEMRKAMWEAHSTARMAEKERALKAQEEAQRLKLQAAEQRRQEQAKADELAAQEEKVKRTMYGDLVHLLVRDQQGRELRAKYRTRMPLRALLGVARKKWGLEKGEVTFARGGAEIQPEATAEALGLKDMDVIEAQVAPDAAAHLVVERKARLKPRRLPRASSRREASKAKKTQNWVVIEPDTDVGA